MGGLVPDHDLTFLHGCGSRGSASYGYAVLADFDGDNWLP